MNEEIWMPINGYEGLYEVSSFGRVKALQKKTRYRIEGFNAVRAEKMIKPSMDAMRLPPCKTDKRWCDEAFKGA